MKYDDAKSTFLLEHCAERCGSYHKDDVCGNCEINAAIEALNKQIPRDSFKNECDCIVDYELLYKAIDKKCRSKRRAE